MQLRPITRAYGCTSKYLQGCAIAAVHLNSMTGWAMKDFVTSMTGELVTINVCVGTLSPASRGIINMVHFVLENSRLRIIHLDDSEDVHGLTMEFMRPLCPKAHNMLEEAKCSSQSLIETGLLPDLPLTLGLSDPAPPASAGACRQSRSPLFRPPDSDDEVPDESVHPGLPNKAELDKIDNFIGQLNSNNLHTLVIQAQEKLAKRDFMSRLDQVQSSLPKPTPGVKQ